VSLCEKYLILEKGWQTHTQKRKDRGSKAGFKDCVNKNSCLTHWNSPNTLCSWIQKIVLLLMMPWELCKCVCVFVTWRRWSAPFRLVKQQQPPPFVQRECVWSCSPRLLFWWFFWFSSFSAPLRRSKDLRVSLSDLNLYHGPSQLMYSLVWKTERLNLRFTLKCIWTPNRYGYSLILNRIPVFCCLMFYLCTLLFSFVYCIPISFVCLSWLLVRLSSFSAFSRTDSFLKLVWLSVYMMPSGVGANHCTFASSIVTVQLSTISFYKLQICIFDCCFTKSFEFWICMVYSIRF